MKNEIEKANAFSSKNPNDKFELIIPHPQSIRNIPKKDISTISLTKFNNRVIIEEKILQKENRHAQTVSGLL
jgi:hypothetical protein